MDSLMIILNFIFSSAFHFFGTLFLIGTLFLPILWVIEDRGRRREDKYRYKKLELIQSGALKTETTIKQSEKEVNDESK